MFQPTWTVLSEENRVSIVTTKAETVTWCRSILGDYEISFSGLLTNPDVVQLSTPASIRMEHPIGTLISWLMDIMPDFLTAQKLASALSLTTGSFTFALRAKRGGRAIVVMRNFYERWDQGLQAFVASPVEVNAVYLMAPVPQGVDCVDVTIAKHPAGKRLFVMHTYKDDWAADYNPRTDFKILESQLDFKFVKALKTNDVLLLTELVVKAVRFAKDIGDPDLTSIVMGWAAETADLLMANTLTRMVYMASGRTMTLELPNYDKAIRGRVATTC